MPELQDVLLQGALKAAVGEALNRQDVPVPVKDVAATATKVMAAIKNEPQVVNALNGEDWFQSRVILGAGGGFVSSLAILLTELTTKRFPYYDWMTLLPAILGVAGTAFALYGRIARGLSPLFGKKQS